MPAKTDSDAIIRDIKRKTRKKYNAEEKISIVLEGLRGEESITAICRREGINPNLYYRWSKEFLEAGKKRLLGDTRREATSPEVTDLRHENEQLKQLVAELSLKNRVLKKSLRGMDWRWSGICAIRKRRRWKRSVWWKSRRSRFGIHCRSWVSTGARSTHGTGGMRRTDTTVWLTVHHGPGSSGTGSHHRSKTRW